MDRVLVHCHDDRLSTPGPGSYDYRDSFGGPKWTIKGRVKPDPPPLAAPYRALPPLMGTGPKVPIMGRHPIPQNKTPGPTYIPPDFGSQSRKSHVGTRPAPLTPFDTPGPGAYNVSPGIGSNGRGSTLHGHDKSIVMGPPTPGPAAYTPDARAILKRSPAAHVGVRPREMDPEDTPGPGAYSLPRDMGGTACYVHVRRREDPDNGIPGPGAYSPSGKPGGPRYSIGERHPIEDRPITAPYRSFPSSIGQGRKVAIMGRHELRGDTTPGPSYIPPGIGASGKMWTMGKRYAPLKPLDTPGPGEYKVGTDFARQARSSSLHGRDKTIDIQKDSPGPAAYTPNALATKRRSPATTIHLRTKLRDPDQTGGYCNLGSTLHGPRYTIGRRYTMDVIMR